MRFIKSKANEFLVVSKNGELKNLGVASSKFILPGQVATFVPARQFKTNFAMTQETKDGIALRFKGVIIYRIIHPETAVKLFEFSDETIGIEAMDKSLADISLGELRDVISHMNMQECIGQRKTTLSNAVREGLESVAGSWGIKIEVAQLAQVFIYDNDIREYLETDVRNELRLESCFF